MTPVAAFMCGLIAGGSIGATVMAVTVAASRPTPKRTYVKTYDRPRVPVDRVPAATYVIEFGVLVALFAAIVFAVVVWQ